MRWYAMPVEDLPAEEYRQRAERFQRVASELSDPLICAKFAGMAADAEAIARVKALCEPEVLASH
jgi:hypothetical protein